MLSREEREARFRELYGQERGELMTFEDPPPWFTVNEGDTFTIERGKRRVVVLRGDRELGVADVSITEEVQC